MNVTFKYQVRHSCFIILFLLLNYKSIGQIEREVISFGTGSSSFKGASINISYLLQRNKHLFVFSYNGSTELGNIADEEPPGWVDKDVRTRYNDNLWDIGILYGRSYKFKKNVFWFSGGPAIYRFIDKELGHNLGGGSKYPSYELLQNKYLGPSVALHVGDFLVCTKSLAFRLEVFCNINKHRPIAGATINILFGNIEKEGTH